MAEANGDGTKEKEGLLRRQIRVVAPKFTAYAEWPIGSGTKYGIRSLVDLKWKDMMGILADISPEGLVRQKGQGAVEAAERGREKLRLLVPDLPDAVLDEMTYQEMLAFMDAALGIGEENPQSAEATST
jgi:hypothetical protein